jgi:methionine-S-sulfoxide reductase
MYATFAGGCFWCLVAPFEQLPGVKNVVSGYAGGVEKNPGYHQVARGETGHREAVQIEYDETLVSYQQLLDIFWLQIDPTDPGGQFADRGFQYTTGIFYHDEMQHELAEASKQAKNESGLYELPIATSIIPYTTFFPAEEEHQRFYAKQPEYYQQYAVGSGRKVYIDQVKQKIS